jgi:hypothetical protein
MEEMSGNQPYHRTLQTKEEGISQKLKRINFNPYGMIVTSYTLCRQWLCKGGDAE